MGYTRKQVEKATLEYFNGNELATNIFFKYCLRDGENFLELTPHDMHIRLAKEFHRIEQKYPNPLDYHTILMALAHFKHIVPQGSPMYGIGNPKPVSLSNCFVIPSPEDNMSSILDSAKNIANLSKRRGGIGLDISKLRPDGAKVNNAANTSSGAWSFADLYSHVGRMIGQGGRRAALMITMDVKHPDIYKFVTMKADKTKVTGANVSIKIRRDFMEAVKNDMEYTLQWPIDSEDPKYTETIRARDLWNLIADHAATNGEPGLLLWDNILETLPAHCYPDFFTVSTNPCGELPLSPGDSCRLISQNLKWLVKDPHTLFADFDYKKLKEMTRIGMRLSDDLVDLEIEKLQQIIDTTDEQSERELFTLMLDSAIKGRRTGLGTHGLHDALIELRLKYDSPETLETINKIYETIKLESYKTSIELAKERGAFPIFDWELEKNCKFYDSFPENLLKDMEKYGRRNISLSTNAPTGSVSNESEVEGFGMEPIFRLSYKRRRKLNYDDNEKPDFIDELGDKWIEFEVYSKLVKEWEKVTGGDVNNLPEYFVTSDQMNWINRVRVQATLSKHIDHSISSTINLPEGTGGDIVGKIYQEAWDAGCKGITVYVDKSRDGVLITEDKSEFNYNDAPTRPEELECDIHQVKIKDEDWTILVGLFEGKPYEVMGGKSSRIEIPNEYKRGLLIKRKNKTVPNRYDLRVNGFKIKDVVATFDNPDNAVLTRMISMNLRHGVKPSFLVEQLSKDPDASFASFAKVLARVMKTYIEDGTHVASGKDGMCPDGSPHDLIYQEGCVMCTKCGYSKCG